MLNIFRRKSKKNITNLKVQGMHCTSCAMNIDGALEDLEGVESADTSYAKAQVTITYDKEKVTESEIIKTIEEQGYTVSQIV